MDSIINNGNQLRLRQLLAALSTAATCGAGVYLFHPAFHTRLLETIPLSGRAADTLGSILIVLLSVVINNAISLVIFKDISLGRHALRQQAANENVHPTQGQSK